MSVLKKFIGYLFLFSIINLSVIGVSRQEAFYSLLSIVYPYIESSQSYNFVLFALNICVGLIFVSTIIKNADDQMLMNNYILVRTSRKTALSIGMLRNLKAFGFIFVIKVLVDLLFSQMNKTENLLKALIAETSIFLTLIIWALFVYIMLQKYISVKWTYFIVICSVIVFQYSSVWIPFFTLFVFGSPAMKKSHVLWLLLKLCLIVILIFINIILSKKYERLNIRDEY